MKKVLLIALHELRTTLSRKSFLLISYGLPILGLLVVGIISLIRGDSTNLSEEDLLDTGLTELKVEGYVDLSGLIQSIPEDLPPGILLPYEWESEALQALESGDITAFYVIPEDYVEVGEFTYVSAGYTPTADEGQDWVMRWTLLVNLLDGDIEYANRVWNPMDLTVTNLAPDPQFDRFAESDCTSPGPACESSPLVQYIPFIMTILFFIFLTQGSGLLIRSVSGEKQSQVMEVLMLSSKPIQLLGGKLIGLGLASLFTTVAWLGSGLLALRMGGTVLSLPPELHIPTSLFAWGLVYFLLGYAVYASLMAGAGALVPNTKEITQATWTVIGPLMAGYIVSLMASGEAPHGGLSTVMSLFPLTSPVVMMMRLTVGGVAAWQIGLSVGLLLLTSFAVLWAVSRMFHAQTLLSGQSFSPKTFFSLLLRGGWSRKGTV